MRTRRKVPRWGSWSEEVARTKWRQWLLSTSSGVCWVWPQLRREEAASKWFWSTRLVQGFQKGLAQWHLHSQSWALTGFVPVGGTPWTVQTRCTAIHLCACLLSRSVTSDSLQPYRLWPMDCSLPGPSVHGILQARILEWVAIPSSKGSSQPRDRTRVCYVSCIGRWVLYH